MSGHVVNVCNKNTRYQVRLLKYVMVVNILGNDPLLLMYDHIHLQPL